MPSRPVRLSWISESSDAALAQGSKSAFVTRELLGLISRWAEISLFTDSRDSSHFFAGIAESYLFDELDSRESEFPSDVRIFQLEDRPRPAAVAAAVGCRRDILWLHDWHERLPGSPSLEQIASNAWTVLFSSPRNLMQYNTVRRLPDGQHLSYPVLDRGPKNGTAVSDRLAYCGNPFAEDQSHILFRAMRELQCPVGIDWMISREEESEARRVLREVPDVDVDLHLGRSGSTWLKLLERAACAAHLHFSAYGDTGPMLPLSLVRGVPVLVSDFSDAQEFPSSAVFKIETGEGEQEAICRALTELFSNFGLRTEIGAAGRATALERYDARAIDSELRHLIESVRIASPRVYSENEALSLGGRI